MTSKWLLFILEHKMSIWILVKRSEMKRNQRIVHRSNVLVCFELYWTLNQQSSVRGTWLASVELRLCVRSPASARMPVASPCWPCSFCVALNLKHFSMRLRLMTTIRRAGAPSAPATRSDNTLGPVWHNGILALKCKNNEGTSPRFHAFTLYQ